MKRLICCIVFSILAFNANAQYGDLYYHRVGDTIKQNPNNGYFEWWDWDAFYEGNHVLYVNPIAVHPVTLVKYYTPVPLKVVGLAASVYGVRSANPVWGADSIQTSRQEYLLLYEADSTGAHKIGELPYNLADRHRYLNLKYHTFHSGTPDTCCHYSPYSYTYPLYEYYFDSTITVYDSFYVGASSYSANNFFDMDSIVPYYLLASTSVFAPEMDCKGNEYAWDSFPCRDEGMQLLYAEFRTLDTTDTTWTYITDYLHYVFYPIVEMDTTQPPFDTCAEVSGVQAMLNGDCLTVSWDSWPHYNHLQLRYGPHMVPQSEWDTVAVTGSTYTLCGVDTTQDYYGISLRAYCALAHDTTDWSPVLWAPMVQSTNAIDNAETELAASVRVSPNPSPGTVTVESRHLLQRIEVVNARGMLVYSEPASGHRTTLDLAMLPAGSYIACIKTTAGTTCKRLVLQ